MRTTDPTSDLPTVPHPASWVFSVPARGPRPRPAFQRGLTFVSPTDDLPRLLASSPWALCLSFRPATRTTEKPNRTGVCAAGGATQHKGHYDGQMATDLVPAGRPLPSASDHPWTTDKLAAAFLLAHTGRTRDAYRRDLASWFGFCADHGVEPLAATRAHVDAYARHQAEVEGRSPATVARRLSSLSGFYRYALGEEAIPRNPVANVKRPKVGTDTVSTGLDKEELAALVAAAEADSPRSLALALLLGLNGLRVSEALGADVGDLGTERGHRVLFITRKGGKKATVPLAPRTAEAVDGYVGGRAEGPFFVTRTGRRWDRSEAWRTLRRLARDAVPAKAGTLHPHDLRHAFVTLSLDSGAALRDVQDAAGHADPRTTRRYDRARHNLDRHPTYALAGILGREESTVPIY